MIQIITKSREDLINLNVVLSAVIEGDSDGPNKALTVLISFCLSCHLTRNVFVLSALDMESQPRYFLIIERSAGTQG